MKSRASVATIAAVLGLAAVGGAYWAGRASAVGAPSAAPLTYSGVLTDASGVPVAGPKNIQLQVFDAATKGNTLCLIGPTATELVQGSFQVVLTDPCVAAIRANADVWLEIFVDGASMGRTKMGAVPFALEAARATSAGGALDMRIATLESLAAQDVAGKAQRICSGSTPVGNTGWVDYHGQIQVTVDISGCHFTTRPTLLTSLGGRSNHWVTSGGSSPYVADATALTSFDIFINNGTDGITPAKANELGWSVQWVAFGN